MNDISSVKQHSFQKKSLGSKVRPAFTTAIKSSLPSVSFHKLSSPLPRSALRLPAPITAHVPNQLPPIYSRPDLASFAAGALGGTAAAGVGMLMMGTATGALPAAIGVMTLAAAADFLVKEGAEFVADRMSGDPHRQTSVFTDLLNGGDFDAGAALSDVISSATTGIATVTTFGVTRLLSEPFASLIHSQVGGQAGKLLIQAGVRSFGAGVGQLVSSTANYAMTAVHYSADGYSQQELADLNTLKSYSLSNIGFSAVSGAAGAGVSMLRAVPMQYVVNFAVDGLTNLAADLVAGRADDQMLARALIAAAPGTLLNIGGGRAVDETRRPLHVRQEVEQAVRTEQASLSGPARARFTTTVSGKPVLFVGKSYMDIVCQISQAPTPENPKVPARVTQTPIAGNAVVAAYAARTLGSSVEMLITMPETNPGPYRAAAAEYGIRLHERPIKAETTAVVEVLGPDRTFRTDRNDQTSGPVPKLDPENYELVHIDGRHSDGATLYAKAFHEAGLRVSYDGGTVIPDVTDRLLDYVTHPVVSEDFVNQMRPLLNIDADVPVGRAAEIVLYHLKQRGATVSAATLGIHGTVFMDEAGHVSHIPALDIPDVVNTNNAGDITHGAIVHSLLANPQFSWEQHLIFARAAAGHSIRQMDIRDKLPTIMDVRSTMENFPEREIPADWREIR